MARALGKAMYDDSEAAARAVFQEVHVRKGVSDSGQAPLANVDAVLVPALVSVERDFPQTAFHDQTTTMHLTWTLMDRNGKVWWVDTVTGEGKGPMGNPYSGNAGPVNMQNALQDLFRRSVADMASAPLIRQYAARVAKMPSP